jgi:hypothetical protein
MVGRYLKFEVHSEFYKIVSHTAGQTAFTVDSAFTGPSVVLGAFKCYLLEYQISNVLRLADSFCISKNQNEYSENTGKIYGIEYRVFKENYPIRNLSEGAPDKFAITRETDDSAKATTIMFNSSVTETTRIEIDYIPYPTDLTYSSSSYPIIPEKYREVLEFGVAFYILLVKKDDQASKYFELIQRKLKSAVNDKNKTAELVSRNRGRLIPRQDQIRRNARRI